MKRVSNTNDPYKHRVNDNSDSQFKTINDNIDRESYVKRVTDGNDPYSRRATDSNDPYSSLQEVKAEQGKKNDDIEVWMMGNEKFWHLYKMENQ